MSMGNKLKAARNKLTIAATMAAVTAMNAMPTLAAGEDNTASNALTTGLNGVKTDVMGYIAIILPIGLGIFGAIWGIKKAIAFFRGVAK